MGVRKSNIAAMDSFFLFSIVFYCSIICCFASQSEIDDENPFTYVEGNGKGPKEWGTLDPHWQACNNGKLQSPIDLLFNKRVQSSVKLGKLHRNYKPAPSSVKNRGHDIEVVWKEDAGGIKINGTYYKLQQSHWHSPSEHTFNGSRYELELHLVHVSSQGKIAVIGIVYKYGRHDPFISKLFSHIKKSVDKGEIEIGILNPGNIKFGSRKYYRYIGSLTIPPCTEGVIWTIIKKVRTVSREQVKALRNAVHDGFEVNARPTQSSDGRPVYMYRPNGNGRPSS